MIWLPILVVLAYSKVPLSEKIVGQTLEGTW